MACVLSQHSCDSGWSASVGFWYLPAILCYGLPDHALFFPFTDSPTCRVLRINACCAKTIFK